MAQVHGGHGPEFSFEDMFASSPPAEPSPMHGGGAEEESERAAGVAAAVEPEDVCSSLGSHGSFEEAVSKPIQGGVMVVRTQSVGLDDFELLTTVGKGAFGKVLQVRRKVTGKVYAMKIMRKDTVISKRAVDYIKTERHVLQHNFHPFIIGLHCAFQTDGKLYLIMDFANGGPLWTHLKRESMMSEAVVQFYVGELVLALEHLHGRGVVHRDLKPENILVDHLGHIRLTDFGLAKQGVKDTDGANSLCGTDEYMAPEVVRKDAYGKAVDWWSLGALMFDMLTGQSPFYAPNRKQMYHKIQTAKVKYPTYLSGAAVSLIKGLLDRDAAKRMQVARGIHRHAFFKGLSWTALENKRVSPPMRPAVKNAHLDVSQFSPQWTRQPACDSPMVWSGKGKDAFAGFTFVPSPVPVDQQPMPRANAAAAPAAAPVATPNASPNAPPNAPSTPPATPPVC